MRMLAQKGVPAYAEDFAELDEDDQAAKVYEPKNPNTSFCGTRMAGHQGLANAGST